MHLLDTNICIFILKNRPESVRHRFKVTKPLGISTVTYGELCYGIEKGDIDRRAERYDQLNGFARRLLVEPWDDECAYHYGVVRAELARQGQIIGSNDLMIAAHALRLDATLVTNNTREFERVPNLKLEDWTH